MMKPAFLFDVRSILNHTELEKLFVTGGCVIPCFLSVCSMGMSFNV